MDLASPLLQPAGGEWHSCFPRYLPMHPLGSQKKGPLPRPAESPALSSTPPPPIPTNSQMHMPMTRKRRRELELEADNNSSGPDSLGAETPIRSLRKRARRSPKLTSKPLHRTPHYNRVESEQPGSGPLHSSVIGVDSDEWLVPTSQSPDLRPYVVSPPRPRGTVLKETTPKPLRRSQGYIDQPSQPLPSVPAIIQASDDCTDGKVAVGR